MEGRAEGQLSFIKENSNLRFDDCRVLELGAGIGKLCERFPVEKVYVTEVDGSLHALLRAKGPLHVLGENEWEDVKYRGFFDLVILSHVFEHFSDPVAWLSKLSRVLRPGGFCFFEVPNETPQSVEYLIKNRLPTGHLFFYDRASVGNLVGLSCSGFEVVSVAMSGIPLQDFLSKTQRLGDFANYDDGERVWLRVLLLKTAESSLEVDANRAAAIMLKQYQRRDELVIEKGFLAGLREKELARSEVAKKKLNAEKGECRKAMESARSKIEEVNQKNARLIAERDFLKERIEQLEARVRDEQTKRGEVERHLSAETQEVERILHSYRYRIGKAVLSPLAWVKRLYRSASRRRIDRRRIDKSTGQRHEERGK